nr:MAG TPA: hypothetical protein [Caudoviricetes sp.]
MLFSINSLYNIPTMIKFHRIVAVVTTKGKHRVIIFLYPLWCLELDFLFGRQEPNSFFVIRLY